MLCAAHAHLSTQRMHASPPDWDRNNVPALLGAVACAAPQLRSTQFDSQGQPRGCVEAAMGAWVHVQQVGAYRAGAFGKQGAACFMLSRYIMISSMHVLGGDCQECSDSGVWACASCTGVKDFFSARV